jgi:hypothetical protein
VGDRKENRTGEKIGIKMVQLLNRIGIAKKQKPVHASIVAQAMINVSFRNNKKADVYTLLDVFKAAVKAE